MTYSRPGPRQTARANAAANPNKGGVRGTSVATGSDSRFESFSNPGQAGKNARQGYDDIKNFLEQIQEPVTNVLKDQDIADANRQVGELVANNPGLPELFREAPQEAQDKIRSLSPRAKDLYLQNLAKGAVTEYGTSFQQAVLDDALLQQPTTEQNRAAQSKRYGELQAEAMQGITSLPPGYVAGVTEQIALYDGQIKGQLETARLAQERKNESLAQSNVFGEKVLEESGVAIGIDASDGDRFEGVVVAAENANGEIEAMVKDAINSGEFTEEQSLTNFRTGITRQLVDLLNDKQYEEAQALLTTVKAMVDRPIMVGPDGKTNFWDIEVKGANGSSSTIQSWIKTAQRQLREGRLQGDRDRTMKELQKYLPGLKAGDPGAEEAMRAGMPTDVDPRVALEYLQAGSGIVGQLAAPTEQQEDSLVGLLNSEAYRSATTEQQNQMLLDAYRAETISSNQFQAAMLGQANKTETESQISKDLDAAQLEAQKNGNDDSVRDILDKAQEEAAESLGTSFDETEQKNLLQSRINQVKARARNAAEAEIRRRTTEGENLSKDDRAEIYNTKLEEEANKEANTYKQSAGLVGAPDVKTRAFVDAIPARLKENPRAIMNNPIKMFTPQLIKDFEKSKGKPARDWKEVFDYLAGRMAQVKDANGDPVYGKDKGEARAWLRNMYKDAVKADMPSLTNNGRRDPAGTRYVPGSKGMPTTVPTKENKGQDQASAPEPQEGATYEWLSAALTSISGGEAKAGTLDNPDNVVAMSQVWSGRQPLSLRTPGLPQKGSSDPAAAPPMAMSSINHPYALAIGIAEGTRTPDGGVTRAYYGHTDPGNGVRNQGNFSAQQGQASPQIADRQWLSKLTRQQMTYQPVLERIGIRRGTQGYNRLMFNILDLSVQAPAAVPDFVAQAPQMLRQGLSVEAIAKARSNAFYAPSGRLDAPGFGNNFTNLFRDQRSRAGVWDYRRRL